MSTTPHTTGQTFAQKALARAAGRERVAVGEVVDARPDRVLSHDNTAAIARRFRTLGVKRVWDPERLAITLDHAAPPPTVRHAQNHAEIRAFVAEQGVRYFFEVGRGICHQVLSEEALVLPGQLVLGADSHTVHFGWLGAFGAGVGRSEVAAIWALGALWLRVPEAIRFVLRGQLRPGVTTKDVALHIIGMFGADGGLYRSVEFDGDGVAGLPLEERMVLANMMAEFGAKNAYVPPDQAVFDWLAPRLSRRTGQPVEVCRHRVEAGALYPDPDAHYEATHEIELEEVEPMVACPHTVDNVVPLSQVAGTRVHLAFVGTCTNGRLSDIAEVARVVRGKRVAPGTRLLVVPASSEVLQEALARGYIADLVEAGAIIGTPGCGPCMGNHMGVLAAGEVCISTANRNFRGRMGNPHAEIYLASPAVVAASAVAGHIAGPDEL
ncbi:MAG: 3-isopropylmalate dehydratase large subunit [Ardenticatenia bacterium]|nr:3-isopropylmalate dehydratase large subunit [Ardenticatenia bacterium]